MAFFKLIDGKYKLCKRINSKSDRGAFMKKNKKRFRDWFIIKYGTSSGYLRIDTPMVNIPIELTGKKVEIILKEL